MKIEDQLEQLQEHLNPSDLPSDSSSSEDNSEEDDRSNYVAYHNLGYDPLGKLGVMWTRPGTALVVKITPQIKQ